jgi:hypothetical protein
MSANNMIQIWSNQENRGSSLVFNNYGGLGSLSNLTLACHHGEMEKV